MSITIRRARKDELGFLAEKLKQGACYGSDIAHCVVFVSEADGVPNGVVVARPIRAWEMEMTVFRDYKKFASPISLRRTLFTLARAIRDWVGGKKENVSGTHACIANIQSRLFGQQAEEFGFRRIYKKGKVYWMDCPDPEAATSGEFPQNKRTGAS